MQLGLIPYASHEMWG